MSKTTTWTGGTDEEYETQHFGFGSQRFKIAVRQMVEEQFQTGCKEMELYLLEKSNLSDINKDTLRQSFDKLIALFKERVEPYFERIDDEIDNQLKIPSNVLLPGDEIQLQQFSNEEYENLKEEVGMLRRRVERGAVMEALLTTELEELLSLEKLLEVAKKDMETVDLIQKNVEGSDNIAPILNNIQLLCNSVPFLKKNNESIFNK